MSFTPLFRALPVQEGDAFLLTPEEGVHYLVDGGQERGRSLVDHLKDEKVDALRVAICTHRDRDHVKGINALMRQGFPVDEYWLPSEWLEVGYLMQAVGAHSGDDWDDWIENVKDGIRRGEESVSESADTIDGIRRGEESVSESADTIDGEWPPVSDGVVSVDAQDIGEDANTIGKNIGSEDNLQGEEDFGLGERVGSVMTRALAVELLRSQLEQHTGRQNDHLFFRMLLDVCRVMDQMKKRFPRNFEDGDFYRMFWEYGWPHWPHWPHWHGEGIIPHELRERMLGLASKLGVSGLDLMDSQWPEFGYDWGDKVDGYFLPPFASPMFLALIAGSLSPRDAEPPGLQTIVRLIQTEDFLKAIGHAKRGGVRMRFFS